MTTYQIDQDMQRWGFHPIDACCLTNDGSYQSITCFERDLSHTEYVNEGFYNPAHSFVEIQQEVLPTLASADISGTMSYGYEDMWNGGHEMGKRLNQMVPIPHVPKVNGEIPSDDEVTSDHQRLLNRLELYDLQELKVSGDGNCQFRSLSDQIYRTPDHHKLVREEVVSQLKSEPELYQNYVPMAYDGYLRKMSKSGEWGDHVTLQAAADFYGVKIFVITSFKDTCYLEILPQIEKSKKTIFLSFWAEVHYNSIYPVGEVPKDEKKKSRWWQ